MRAATKAGCGKEVSAPRRCKENHLSRVAIPATYFEGIKGHNGGAKRRRLKGMKGMGRGRGGKKAVNGTMRFGRTHGREGGGEGGVPSHTSSSVLYDVNGRGKKAQ